MAKREDKHRNKGPASEFKPKDPIGVSVTLTRLGKEILAAAAKRTGVSRSDVVEGLLRQYGNEIKFN